MEKRHRIFIAVNLPEDIKRQLFLYSEKWPELPAKWTTKDNLHITLEFLGHLTDQEIADVCKISGEVAKRHKAFSITLTKVLYGPPKKIPPRMVWAEGEKSDDLTDLKQDLQEYLLERVSFRPDDPKGSPGFSPHITLARIREWEWKKIEPEERPQVFEEIDITFTVESIEVEESELKKGGPQYTILESHNLGE